eukprot:365105-Chlamydomonas_euryale.AAC.10
MAASKVSSVRGCRADAPGRIGRKGRAVSVVTWRISWEAGGFFGLKSQGSSLRVLRLRKLRVLGWRLKGAYRKD